MKNPKPEQYHTAQAVSARSNEEPDHADESRSEIGLLKEEIGRLNHELRREHEMYIRNLADFDNYRRRVERAAILRRGAHARLAHARGQHAQGLQA